MAFCFNISYKNQGTIGPKCLFLLYLSPYYVAAGRCKRRGLLVSDGAGENIKDLVGERTFRYRRPLRTQTSQQEQRELYPLLDHAAAARLVKI